VLSSPSIHWAIHTEDIATKRFAGKADTAATAISERLGPTSVNGTRRVVPPRLHENHAKYLQPITHIAAQPWDRLWLHGGRECS
jgi:hypothetical protein